MPKLAYFPWYGSEAAGDSWWRSLTLAEKGFHLELLSLAWSNGGLEKDLDIVARSLGITRQEFDTLWKRVCRKWLFNGEFIINRRQEQERTKITKISGGAAASAHKKWEKIRIETASQSASEPHPIPQYGISDPLCGIAARASDSDSDSDSKEGIVKGDDIGDWCEAVYARHPKKKNKYVALLKLKDTFQDDLPGRALLDCNHLLWIKTEDWMKLNGRFVPLLDEWVADDAWKVAPNGFHPVVIDRLPKRTLEEEFPR